jgi:hypothetical protein
MPSDHDEYNKDLGLKYLVSKYAKGKTPNGENGEATNGKNGEATNGKNGEATRDLILKNLPAI